MKTLTSTTIKISDEDLKEGVVLLAKETYNKMVREKQMSSIRNLKKVVIPIK
mgnify:CR=1